MCTYAHVCDIPHGYRKCRPQTRRHQRCTRALTTCFSTSSVLALGFGQAFDGGSCTLRERLDQPGFLMRHPSWRSKFPTPDASTEPAIVIVPSSQFTSTSSVWGKLLMGEGHVHLESDSVILIQRRASRSICRKKLCHWLQHPNGNLRRCPRVQP